MKLKQKINGYDVELDSNYLVCGKSCLGLGKFNDIMNAYITFTEYFTVNDNDIIINKDNAGKELFNMIIPFSELKAIYKELRDKPKVHHLKANNIELKWKKVIK